MTEVEAWKSLNWELHATCGALCSCLAPHAEADSAGGFAIIAHGFVLKATRTLKAINVLYDSDLKEQAQALVRMLFELRLNFDCFLKLADRDVRAACRRVWDSMILEKFKQMRASGYAGISDELRSQYQQEEQRIAARYSKKELGHMARHGFTGMSIEDRSRFTGHEAAYQLVYRNFSRNIHSTDYLEHSLDQVPEAKDGYIESRDVVSLYTAHFAAGGIAEFANIVFHCGFDRELDEIGIKQQEIKSSSP